MATENLKVKITADASQAKAEIGKFKDSLKGAVSEGESATKSIGRVTAELGVLLATLKTVKAAVKNAIDVAAQGDAIKDNAQKVFMNTTAYQEWGYVLKQNGVELSALKTAMRQFAPQVASGSEALRQYGITTTNVDTAFQQAIFTIQNMSSETERIAAATQLFGSRALELFPVLNLTNAETQNLMATYRALGGTMSNELIAASDVCTDSITAMKAAWGGLRNVLAQYFLPIITKVVRWITIAIAYVRILLSAIFGLKASFGGGGGNKKTSLPATTGAVAANTGNTAGNLKKAAKHAKELKRTLMGIDELTKLVEQATSAAASPSGGGGGGGGGIGDVGVGDPGTFDGIISDETLEKIENFRKKVDEVKGLLNGAYLILKGLVEISLGNFTKGWEDLKEGIKKVWDNLKELFPWLGKIEKAFGTLKTKWEELKKAAGDKIIEFKAEFKEKVKEGWKILTDWWAKRVGGLREFWAKFKESVKTGWKTLTDWWAQRKSGLREFWAKFKETVKAGWDALVKWWKNRKAGIREFLVNFKEKVRAGWSALVSWWKQRKAGLLTFVADFKEKVREGWTSLVKWWKGRVAGYRQFLADFKETVKEGWKTLIDWWSGRTGGYRSFVAEFVDNVKDAWNKFKEWWKNLKGGAKEFIVKFGFVDKLKSAWNGLANKVNDARAKSSVAAALLPYIPTLAKGGILTAPTMAVMGEYPGARSNPEIATPQSLMAETIRDANGDLVSAFASMTRQVIAAIEDKDLNVRIGDETIARSAQRGNSAYKNRTGKALLTI